MNDPDVSLLKEMGFSDFKIKKALDATGNKGVNAAMDWLLDHANELAEEEESIAIRPTTSSEPQVSTPEVSNFEANAAEASVPDASAPEASAPQSSESDANAPEAKSIQCNVCKKLFKAQYEVEFHAVSTGHSDFSESEEEKKPLSEEEKQEQMKLLDVKMREKRKQREEKEQQDEIEREKNRIKAGKELSAAKKKLADEEMKKIVNQRKREKEEDRMARQRVKDQIEADKLARREKFAKNSDSEFKPFSPQITSSSQAQTLPKDYNETRIQIRLTDGTALAQSFSPKEQLSAVRLFIELNRTDGSEPFNIMTNFPKRVFSTEDYNTPLEVLGLVPSAVLIVTKASTVN